ncbi:hypothetical protein WS68_04115 [Burkholderia sp. TSV86]|nr:hypothetical protein WS68_04115 [Burkholderia sp. TSV86]
MTRASIAAGPAQRRAAAPLLRRHDRLRCRTTRSRRAASQRGGPAARDPHPSAPLPTAFADRRQTGAAYARAMPRRRVACLNVATGGPALAVDAARRESARPRCRMPCDRDGTAGTAARRRSQACRWIVQERRVIAPVIESLRHSITGNTRRAETNA